MVKAIVKVQTWGTEAGYALGVRNFLAASLRRENVGHASIELQFPVNDETEQFINQYCTEIPHEVRTIIDPSGQQEEVYVVRFSFLPSSKAPFRLNTSYNADCMYERFGHQTTMRHALETNEFPERGMRIRNIKVFQASTLTPRGKALDFHTAKGKYILNVQKIRNLEDQLETAEFLRKNLNKKKSINKNNRNDKPIFLAANALNIAFGKHESNELALGLLEKKVSEITHQIQQLKEDNVKKIHPQLISEGESQLASVLTDQSKFDALLARHEKIEAFKHALNALLEVSKQDGIQETELFSLVSEVITNNPILGDFEADYAIIQFINRLLVGDINLTEPPITPREAISMQVGTCIQYLNVEDKQCREHIFTLRGAINASLDAYLCTGRPADGEVILPLNTSDHDDEHAGELHLESMLQQIQSIVSSPHPYNIRTNNCSSTAMAVLNAGRLGSHKTHEPSSWYQLNTPQMVYNAAVELRNNFCRQRLYASMDQLDALYTKHHIKPLERSCKHLHEALLSFAVDTIFPSETDKENNLFYRFDETHLDELQLKEDNIISTELLRDLWGIIPERNLPLVKDGSLTIAIDQNLTLRELMQGLAVLTEINTEKRLTSTALKHVVKAYKESLQDLPQPDNGAKDETPRLSKKSGPP